MKKLDMTNMFLRILCTRYAQNIVSSTFFDTALALALQQPFFIAGFEGLRRKPSDPQENTIRDRKSNMF